jgi:hypothetical protein
VREAGEADAQFGDVHSQQGDYSSGFEVGELFV